MHRTTRLRQHAFTLIELLVVVAIIALLISILLPSLSKAREQAKNVVCSSNMHQIVLGTTYYADSNADHLPWLPGTQGDPLYGYFKNGPYKQYHQLLLLYPYVKDLNIFKCPSARGVIGSGEHRRDQNSVKMLFGTGTLNGDGSGGQYFVRWDDLMYTNTAQKHSWWPSEDPSLLSTPEFPNLYTEYFFDDYQAEFVNDGSGRKYPAMNGGNVGKIYAAQYAAPFSEYSYFNSTSDDDQAGHFALKRHSGKTHFGFLDGHVEPLANEEYMDVRGGRRGTERLDFDPYGNRCWWVWGLSKTGADIGPDS